MHVSKKSNRLNQQGYTFFEVMVTLTILSLGLVGVFKVFFVSLDQLTHVNHRMYANIELDNRIRMLERTLKAYKILPIGMPKKPQVDVGHKILEFEEELNIKEIKDYLDIFQVDIALSWKERERSVRLSRSAYIVDYGLPAQE